MIMSSSLLLLYQASDTVPGMVLLRDFYSGGMAGHSIAASEHSTITAWGRHGELEAFRNSLQRFPDGQCGVIMV